MALSTPNPDSPRPGTSTTKRRIGEALVDGGLVSAETMVERLAERHREGVHLGRVLMARGDITRLELWAALADGWGLDQVNLRETPPDPTVLSLADPEVLLEQSWVPLRFSEPGVLVVAVSAQPDETTERSILDHIASASGARDTAPVAAVTFVATTDWDIEQAVLACYGDTLVARAAFELAERSPELSAAEPLVGWQKAAGLIAATGLGVATFVDWRVSLMFVLVTLNTMFAIGVGFKLVMVILGMFRLRAVNNNGDESVDHPGLLADGDRYDRRWGPGYEIPDDELPIYTILIPAYGEANVIGDLVRNITALDYPMSKLQVLLLLEEDDAGTIAAAKAARPPDYVRIVVIPPGGPQTKPKACNVGLAMADGEFLVIFDAEDRPEPGQLREAVAAFRDASDDTVCFQARLNYFNVSQNILTRMFTLEYSSWFDYMLPGLDAARLPIPLGGTSNHFRTRSLRTLGGWDPFNVTEDADLGVRAASLGYRVGIIDSTTWEEACSEWTAWIRQRTRWIKGYMVTALVQLRDPLDAQRRLGWRGMTGLVGLIAGTPMLFLAAPVVWTFFAFTFLGGVVPQFHLPQWIDIVCLTTLVVGNLSMIAITAAAARRRGNTRLAAYALLNPLYWVLHSIAAWRALWQLLHSPSHWEKTPHGLEHGPAERTN